MENTAPSEKPFVAINTSIPIDAQCLLQLMNYIIYGLTRSGGFIGIYTLCTMGMVTD
jgi:hypothetical protein